MHFGALEWYFYQRCKEMGKNDNYRDYPEGSGGKKIYDRYNLAFQDYLDKYYRNPDLSRWEYINSKFVIPLFQEDEWSKYNAFFGSGKTFIFPSQRKERKFLESDKN